MYFTQNGSKKQLIFIHSTGHSRIFSPVEKTFHTTVPTMYSTTETLNTPSQEPASQKNELKRQ
jgi:hypothetical protein